LQTKITEVGRFLKNYGKGQIMQSYTISQQRNCVSLECFPLEYEFNRSKLEIVDPLDVFLSKVAWVLYVFSWNRVGQHIFWLS